MLNPEKAQGCLEALVHNIFTWLSSDKYVAVLQYVVY